MTFDPVGVLSPLYSLHNKRMSKNNRQSFQHQLCISDSHKFEVLAKTIKK